MADVFVSYSRRDSEFVRRIADSISEGGKEVWLDTEGIADGEVFPEAIKRAIEQSDAFLFVITPDSVGSAYCENEVEYARELQKRIVPVLREPVLDSDLPAEIRDRNWIPFTDEAQFDSSLGRLVTALDTDLEANKAHTRWLVKALEWDKEDRDKSFLLRGSELKAAEAWLAASPEDADPAPTPLQREYLLASRNASAGRQRVLMGASLVVAAVSIGLLIFALISRGQAISSRQAAVSERIGARSQALAAESQAQLPNDPEISVILATRAVHTKPTPQSMFALRAALDASPLEQALPTVADPGSCATNSGLSAASRPGREQVAEASCNGLLRLLDPASGQILRQEHLAGQLTSVAYSPNGATLAVGTAAGVMLLDPDTGAVTARSAALAQSDDPVNAIAFSPNGQMLAADLYQTGVVLLAVPGLHIRKTLRVLGLNGTIVFSRDGRLVIVGGSDAAVHIFDVATRRLVHKIVAPQQSDGSWPEVVALSPDGTQLAVGYPTLNYNYGYVTLYNTHGWRAEYTVMQTDTGEVSSVAFSPDGTRLAVGLEDGTAGVWSLITRDQLDSYAGMTSAVTAIEFLRGGQTALTVANDGIGRVWRANGTSRTFATVPGNITSLALGGSSLAILQVNRRRTYLSTFALPAGAPLLTRYVGPGNNTSDSLSPDSRFLVTTGNNTPGRPQVAPIRLWSVARGEVLHTLGRAVVTYSTFSADDSRVLLQEGSDLSSSPGYMVVVNASTGHAVRLQDPPACVLEQAQYAFSANDEFVAAAAFCGLAEVWNARTGKLIREVTQGGETSAVALNPDGSRLLVSSWDSRATIWSVATGRRVVQLVGHTSGIATAALSPDGSLVATSGLDDTVRVWNAHTGQELRLLTFAHWQQFVAFSPDGAQLAVAQNTPIQGVADYAQVYDACPDCSHARGLLTLAKPLNIPPSRLTSLENTVIGRS
jgi:WD40 repeat protein